MHAWDQLDILGGGSSGPGQETQVPSPVAP